MNVCLTFYFDLKVTLVKHMHCTPTYDSRDIARTHNTVEKCITLNDDPELEPTLE